MNTDMQTYHNNVFEQIVLTAARLKTTVAAATKFYYSNVSSQKDFYQETITPMLETENFPDIGSVEMERLIEKLKNQWITESGIN